MVSTGNPEGLGRWVCEVLAEYKIVILEQDIDDLPPSIRISGVAQNLKIWIGRLVNACCEVLAPFAQMGIPSSAACNIGLMPFSVNSLEINISGLTVL